MPTVSHPFESNNPHTLQSWAVGLPDDPAMEMAQAIADQQLIELERAEQLADVARIAAEDAQQLADIDSDFADYIGTAPIHTLIDAFTRRDTAALHRELSRLATARSSYRTLFTPHAVPAVSSSRRSIRRSN